MERDGDWIEQRARILYTGLRDGLIVWHLRMESDELMDAVVGRVKALAHEDGVRLVIKRENEGGRVRYRLRRRREGE